MSLDHAHQVIRDALATARAPIAMWSGGKESMLLLHLLREIKFDIEVLWFKTDLQDTRWVKQVIRDLDLIAWSFAPADIYYVPNGDGVTLVHDYKFDHQLFPVMTDVVEGERCGLRLSTERTTQFDQPWDTIFIGYRDDDYHETLGAGFLPADGYQLGQARVYAPLRQMTEADVWEAIRELGVPYNAERYNGGNDPDTVSLCTRCFASTESSTFCPDEQRMIPVTHWDRQASLDAFRRRLEVIHGERI